ncbi:MAG: hypothetical protein WBA51_14900 [Erythrobacter sp.]
MTTITAIIDVREHTAVPGNASIELTPIGTIGGIKLADGRLVRPWLNWEIEDFDGTHRDLTFDELSELGFVPTLDKTIAIEIT